MKVRIKPYKSTPIPVHGQARSAVTFGQTCVPVMRHIISRSCEPVLARKVALKIGTIDFNANPDTFHPILMIEAEDKGKLQEILMRYPPNFNGIGKLHNHKVKLHVDKEVKPVHVPPRLFPYHLKERAQKAIEDMIQQGVIEEHPRDEPAPWVASVLAPNDDGSLRVTMDARNVNKSLYPTNYPIPRHEDIKAKLSGCRVFSKMDLKSAFWQIELEPESRYLTVFHANDKLYRYKRLTMGLEPSQG